MRLRAFLVLLEVLFCCLCAAADQPAACPATVNVQQQLAARVVGWSSMLDDAPHQLAGITLYDGPPQDKASLAYDDITKAAGKQVTKWSFTPHSERPIWIACSYSGTSVVLMKALPATVSGCVVT
jgi:hypothetical protein